MALQNAEIENEAELEALLIEDSERIEKGFLILTNQRKTDGLDAMDILGVDFQGILTIVELKVRTDKGQLRQALKYYDWTLSQGLDWFKDAYKQKLGAREISDSMPQIILISPSFDDEMLIETKYIRNDITVRLFKYKPVEVKGTKEIVLFEEDIPGIKAIESKPWVLKDNIDYFIDDEIRTRFLKLIEQIRAIDSKIEEKIERKVIRFFINGRKICETWVTREYFNIGYKTADSENQWEYDKEIKTDDQTLEALNKAKTAYELMKISKRKKKDNDNI